MISRAIRHAVAGLGCLAACAVARPPTNEPGQRAAGDQDASATSTVLAASAGGDGGPAAPDAAEAAVAAGAADASLAEEDRDAGPGLVFDLGVARSGESKVAAVINVEAFRASTAGRQLGPVIAAFPQWGDFTRGTDLGIAWVLFTGSSLDRMERGNVVMYCTATDAKIDRWLEAKRSDKGSAVDAGPGVHAVLGRVDRTERVFMRPQSHLVAIVPPESARQVAGLIRDAHLPPHADPGEAFRLRARSPQRAFSELPASVTEIRFWIAPRKDQGADFFFESDTSGATFVAQQLHDLMAKEIDPSVRNATLGLLDHPDISADGDVAKVHVRATASQLAALLQIVQTNVRP
jgi:hypothetical protein